MNSKYFIYVSQWALIAIALGSQTTNAWGQNGHRIVAEIAERHLTAPAKQAVKTITKGQYLAQLANWPDEIRSDRKWDYTHSWHYINIDDHQTLATVKRNPRGDVLMAMQKFEAQLRDPKSTPEQQWQALAFYTHFVGDIHQPLHAGRSSDLGGSKIMVKFFRKTVNLHELWDTELVEQQRLSFREFADFIDQIDPKQVKKLQDSNYEDWIMESKALRPLVYDFPQPDKGKPARIGYAYVEQTKTTVAKRVEAHLLESRPGEAPRCRPV